MPTSLTNPPLFVAETVDQATSITTAVTLNAKAGVITTQAGDVGANQNVTFTFNNTFITNNSPIFAYLQKTSTTFGTGNPTVQMNAQANGSVNIVLGNADDNATTAETFEISFLVL